MTLQLQPRFVRQVDAPGYLGIDRNKFDEEVRPTLTVIPLGKRALAYDRQDLDAWADAYKAACGRPGRKDEGSEICELGQKGSSSSDQPSGSSTRSTGETESSSALARSARMKQKRGSVPARQKSTLNTPTSFATALSACGQLLRRNT